MINISNYPGNDNPPREVWGDGSFPRGVRGYGSPRGKKRGGLGGLSPGASAVLDWLAYLLRRCGDRWFAMNDTEAYWRGWQITKTHGGLGRRYRDLRFDTLAACAQCAGAGEWADAPCGPCLGTGRITIGEVG